MTWMTMTVMLMAPQAAYAQAPKNITVPELSPVSIKVIANDTDVPAQTVTFNVTGLPTWASLNATSGEITGTPGETDNGNSTVTINAYDGHGGTDRMTFTLTVTEVNSPPKLSIIVENNTSTTTSSAATAPTMAPAAPATNQTSSSPPANTTSSMPPSNQTSSSAPSNTTSTLPPPAAGSNQTSSSFLTENNATLVPTPLTIKPGGQLTLAGSGFGKSQQVTFMVDNSTLATGTLVVTDATGAFTATATLPVSVTSGTHLISAASMNGIKATASIIVQQQA